MSYVPTNYKQQKQYIIFFRWGRKKIAYSLSSNQQLERFNEEANNNSRSGVAISGDEPGACNPELVRQPLPGLLRMELHA